MNPLFSVIIPAYNSEATICKALDSVAAQTMSDYEIIVVDDGSTDGTLNKLFYWGRDYPLIKETLIHHPTNKGMGAARNTAIREASGTYLAFLDADDIWLPNKLKAVAAYLKKKPLTDLLCHDVWLEEVKGVYKPLRCGPHKTYRDLLFKGNCFFLSGTVARRMILTWTGVFSEDKNQFHGVEDYDLWLGMAKIGCKIEYLHETLGVYCSGGMSSDIAEHCDHTLNVLYNWFRNWEPQSLCYRYLMRRAKARILRGAGHEFMKRGAPKHAKRYLRAALKQDPFDWRVWALIILNIGRVRK